MPNLKEYQPDFKWLESSSGELCIYDKAKMVAAFYPGTSLLPDNNSAALRPVSLHNLRLIPGGQVMIEEGEICGPLCLSWRKHLIFNMEIEELKVDDSNPERLKLHVITHDTALRKDQPGYREYKPDNVKEETWLELTYDHSLRSYVYDVRTCLTVMQGREEFMFSLDMSTLEFGDILPAGANDFFPPRGSKKYTHIVYKATDGQLYNRPQNKHLGPDKIDVFYAPDGFAAFVAESDGNPVVGFLDNSGTLARSEICWAMYDLHFKCRRNTAIERIKAGKPLEFHYRLYSVSQEKGAEMLRQSQPDPILNHSMVRCPVFNEDGVNAFTPSDEYQNPSDKWFWLCSDPTCHWDWDTGFRTSGSLMITRKEERYEPSFPDAPWARIYDFFTDGSESSQWVYNRLPGNRDYKIKAMVRTENVTGRVFIAVQYQVSLGETGQHSAGLKVSKKTLSGSSEWTEIMLNAKPPAGTEWHSMGLFLVLEGKGNCWFDEVQVTPIK